MSQTTYSKIKSLTLELLGQLSHLELWINVGENSMPLNEGYFTMYFRYRYNLLKANQPNSSEKELKEATFQGIKGRLMENLYILTILNEDLVISDLKCLLINISDTKSPIPVSIEGEKMFLWIQHRIPSTVSGLGAIPDITITKDEEKPKSENIYRIIECKCVENLSATTIRTEIAKAFDLRVVSYTMINYYKTTDALKGSASNLGLNLIDFAPILEAESNLSVILDRLTEQVKEISLDRSFQALLASSTNDATSKLLI
jgi:hypothetical protein